MGIPHNYFWQRGVSSSEQSVVLPLINPKLTANDSCALCQGPDFYQLVTIGSLDLFLEFQTAKRVPKGTPMILLMGEILHEFIRLHVSRTPYLTLSGDEAKQILRDPTQIGQTENQC